MMQTILWFVTCAAVALAVAPLGHAQSYPGKPIRFVVPFVPGGGTDLMARSLAPKLSETWGQPVVVENRAGGSGAVGSLIVKNAAPDGYTLLLITSSTHAIAPTLYRKPPFDPLKDFTGITLIATAPQMLVAHSSVRPTSIRELVAVAKSRPGTLNYASPGSGSIGHMTMELFKKAAGVNIVHIPYKGSGDAARGVLGGEVQLSFSAPGSVMAHVRAGRLNALAVATSKRSPGLADVPTFAEQGFHEVEAANWYGVVTTAGTPIGVVNKLNGEIVRIVRLPEIKELFFRHGYEAVPATPNAFAKYMSAELAKWRQVADTSGARLD